ncbi:unnamed protein product [Toxocara canis]|uniref:Uncharacterized protein n=1 Tax=Toxocara canis TaxID=6265 RepID=A0A183USL8_TOXCA|nr:unnamed protein product [Toxocara canis]
MIFNTKKYDECPATKRELLAYTAEFYDPLGLLTPATLSLKLFLQQLWKKEYDCDQPFDNTDRQNAETPLERFQRQSLKLTWQLTAERDKQRTEIRAFMDASKDAYAAVAYLRFYKENRYESSLLMSKSRVAPMRGITIPRLDLMAALVGSRLLRFVQGQLKHTGPLFLWSDSQATLQWIATTTTVDRLLYNRIAEIRRNPAQFRCVDSANNAVDWQPVASQLQNLRTSPYTGDGSQC